MDEVQENSMTGTSTYTSTSEVRINIRASSIYKGLTAKSLVKWLFFGNHTEYTIIPFDSLPI